jgi:hypothetical protein
MMATANAALDPAIVAAQVQNRRSKFPPPPSLDDYRHAAKPKNGFVPDQATAIRIAEAVLVPIYGEKNIQSERPFKATLKNGVWTVTGTLPPQSLGGTAIVRLSKADGRILLVTHEA